MTDPLLEIMSQTIHDPTKAYRNKRLDKQSIIPEMSVENVRQNKIAMRQMTSELRPWRLLPCGLTASEFAYLYMHYLSTKRNLSKTLNRSPVKHFGRTLPLTALMSSSSNTPSASNLQKEQKHT
jgi:hypothetical protein